MKNIEELKVNDIVKVNSKCDDIHVIGKIGKIIDVDDFHVTVQFFENIDGCWGDNHDKWCLEKDEVILMQENLNKEFLLDLPIGTKLFTDREENNCFIKINDNEFENDDNDVLAIKEDKFITSDFDFEKNEINFYGNRYKIIKIERPNYYSVYEKEQHPKEMTIKEISEILGYDVKIVKEN